MAFTIVSGFFFLGLGLAVWAAISAHDNRIASRDEATNSIPVSGAADKSTFARAIDIRLAKQCIRVTLNVPFGSTTFPVSIPDGDASIRQYEVLTKAGLLTAVNGWVKPSSLFGVIPATQTVPGKIYSLTDQGKQALLDPRSTVFCAGHYKVDEVQQFTVPGNVMGATVSEVTFTYSPSDVPAWTIDNDVQAAFPDLITELAHKRYAHAMLVLTNDGWDADLSMMF
jgi:hypothetical protein